MTTYEEIPIRVFTVGTKDERTGREQVDAVAFTKATLEAARKVGESHTELIYRMYNRRGYRVTYIGKPQKRTVKIDLLAASAGMSTETANA